MSLAIFLIIAGLQGVMSVALGAYSAHGMESGFAAQAVAWVETGTRYQMTHACALLATAAAIGCVPDRFCRLWLIAAGAFFAFGGIVFPGALYGLAFLGDAAFGTAAPIGGGALILGWVVVTFVGGVIALRRRSTELLSRSAASPGGADYA